MTNSRTHPATHLLVDKDVDAFIDQELPDQRQSSLRTAVWRNAALADHIVDRSVVLRILAGAKQEVYQSDPRLRETIALLMARREMA